MSPFNRRVFMKSGALSVAAAADAEWADGQTRRLRFPNQAGRGIKIACSLDLWTGGGASLSGALAAASAAGYRWVEGNASYLWEFRDRHDALQRMLEQRQLGCITGVYTANFADLSRQNLNVSRAVQLSRALASLGSDFLILGAGTSLSPRQPADYQNLSRCLSEVGARVYEDTGLHCAYRFQENEGADIRKIIATSDSRYTKFCFDTLFLMRLGIDPVPMILTYRGRLIHVHLHDGTNQGGEWREVPVGRGKLKLDAVLQALCAARYNGWVTVEQENAVGSPLEDATQSRERIEQWLQAYAARVGSVDLAADRRAPDRNGHEISAQHPERRETLHQLVVLGAAMSTGVGMLRPTAFSTERSTAESPMVGMSEAMQRDMKRPAPPLPPRDPYFRPFFFAEDEYRDVSVLVNAIIPADDEPGALDARADEYADFMIWLDQGNHQKAHEEVDAFRRLCSELYKRNLCELARSQVDEFLNVITAKSQASEHHTARSFFNRIRRLTAHAYYASPQGLLEDLGFKGNTYVSEFKGCTNPEYLGKWYQILSHGTGSDNEPKV